MKIRSFAGGGISYLPTTSGTREAAATTASSASSKTKVPGFADKIVDMIRENGVDNDVAAFLRQVNTTLDLAGDPTGENLSLREIVSLANKANIVRNNYKSYENVQQALTTKNAWGELALTSTGGLYAYNNEKQSIEAISAETYSKNRDKYIPLTNADLLNQRRSNSSLAYDTSILDDLSNVVSTEDIMTNLRDIINNFKDTEVQGYLGKNGANIQSGLSQIVNSMMTGDNDILKSIQAGPNGVYTINQKSTFVDKDVSTALNFLKVSLPPQHRRAIEAKAAVEGYDSDAMLLTMLCSNTARKITADYEATTNNAAGSGSGSSNAQVQHTLAETYAEGSSANPTTMLSIVPNDSTSGLVTPGNNVGPVLVDSNGNPGNPIGVTSVAQIIESAYGVGRVTKDMTVTFGDQQISREQLGGLVYTGSDMHRVVLPCKTSENGRDIVPDFELQKKLDNIVTTAKNHGEDDEAITRYIQQVCPGATYNAKTGGIVLPKSRCHAFLTFEAVGADNFIDFDSKSEYLVKTEWNPDAYVEAAKYGYANHKKNDEERVAGSASKHGWFTTVRKHLYQGNVFMPITSSIAGASQYNQEYIPKSQYTNITGRAIESQRQAEVQERLADRINTNW